MSRKTRDIIMIIIGILGVAFLFWFLYVGRITWVAFPFLVIGFAISLVLIFRFDRIKRLVFESKLLKGLVDLKVELETSKKIVESVKDLEVYAEDKVIVGDERAVTIVKPKVLKLESVINKVEVLVNKVEKELKAEISGESDASADLTVEKKRKK